MSDVFSTLYRFLIVVPFLRPVIPLMGEYLIVMPFGRAHTHVRHGAIK